MILLNHQHLYYFWTVAKEGSVARACERLHLAQSTVSGQVIQLERNLGAQLFERRHKRSTLTKKGRLVLDYAEKIFGQTREMLDALKNEGRGKTYIRLGIDEGVSKQGAFKLLAVIQKRHPSLRALIVEGHLVDLLERLDGHTLDLVLSDQGGIVGQYGNQVRVEVGKADILFVAAPAVARRVHPFPRALSKVPLLIHPETSPLWGSIQHFLIRHEIAPDCIIEIEDAGLIRVAAINGLGAAPLSSLAVEQDLREGKLVRLGRKSLGITKTLYLTARKGYPRDSLIGYLIEHFRFR